MKVKFETARESNEPVGITKLSVKGSKPRPSLDHSLILE